MKFDHELFDSCMHILRFAHKKLLERGDSTPASMFGDAIKWNEEQFLLNIDTFIGLVPLALKNWKVVIDVNHRDLNPDEKAAVLAAIEGTGPRAVSTEDGHKAVKIAHKRLVKAEKMRPVTEAKERLDKAEALKAEKRRLSDEAQAERDRPERDYTEAEKEARQASDDLKKAEKEIGV